MGPRAGGIPLLRVSRVQRQLFFPTHNVLLALIPSEQGQPLAHFFELYHRQPSRAPQLILNSYPILWVCQSNALMKTQSRSNLSLRKSRAFKFSDP